MKANIPNKTARKGKWKMTGRVGVLAGLSGLVGLLPVFATSVDAAEIKSTPEKQVWIADGQTEYTLRVYVDNTGLNGEPTDGVQARVNNPAGFEYVDGSVGVPPVEIDFFSGQPMFWQVLGGPGFLSGRLTQEIGGGPVDSNGFVLEQKYKVSQGFATGVYSFPLSDTKLFDVNGQLQPHTVSADSVWVFQSQAEGQAICLDESGPGKPYTSPFCGHYDSDNDLDVDLADIAKQRANPASLN